MRDRIFLCHADADKEAARHMYKNLEYMGFNPWIDEENIEGGDYEQYIRQVIMEETAVVIVFLSNAMLSSQGFVHEEVRLALQVMREKNEFGLSLVPVRVDHCKLPASVRHLQCWDTWDPLFYGRLVRNIKRELAVLAREKERSLAGFQKDQTGPESPAKKEG